MFFLVDGLKNWNDKAINLFTISLWTRTRSLLFSSTLTHVTVLSIHRATWYEGEKGPEVYLSATFSLASLFSDSKVPFGLYSHRPLVLVPSSASSVHQCFQTMIWDKPPGICRPQKCRPRCLTRSAIKGSSDLCLRSMSFKNDLMCKWKVLLGYFSA